MDDSVLRLARRAALDPHFLAHALAEYAALRGWDEPALAAALGVDAATLAAVRLCRAPRADAAGFREDTERIAVKFALDRDLLAKAARHGHAVARLARAEGDLSEPAMPFLAARDRKPERGE